MANSHNFASEGKITFNSEFTNVTPSAPPLETPSVDGPPPPYPGDPSKHVDIHKPDDQKISGEPGTEGIQQPQILENGTSTVIIVPESVDVGSTMDLVVGFDFSEKAIRLGFVRKVFGLVFIQLMITCIIIVLVRQSPGFYTFAIRFKWFAIFFLILTYIFTFLLMLWNEDLRKKVPHNYILLFVFTLTLATLVGITTYPIGNDLMLMAGLTTIVVVIALTLFAFQTKIDFTFLSCSCLCLLLIFTIYGLAMVFVPYKWANLLYTTLVIVISAIYIVWDIQLIIGGKHRCSISPEEYVFAALILYYDIVYLFLRILRSRQ